MTTHAWPLDAGAGSPAYSGRTLRESQMSPLLFGTTGARPFGARSGVRPGTSSATVAVSGSTWTVRPHAGVLDVQAAAEAGPYGYAVDADVAGSVNAAHATYTRWDGIYVCLDDPAESDGSSVPALRVEYVAGTAAPSPAMPTAPARSMLLARLVVPNSGGGSTSVVWLAPRIAAAGGIIPVRDTTDRATLDAYASTNSPVVAFRSNAPAGQQLEYSNSAGTWVTVGAGRGTSTVTGFASAYPLTGAQVISRAGYASMVGTFARISSNGTITGTYTQIATIDDPTLAPAVNFETLCVNTAGQVFQTVITPAGVVSIRSQSGSITWALGTSAYFVSFGTWPLS